MKRLLVLLALVVCWGLHAQNALKAYQWRDHLAYNNVSSVTTQGNKIFAVANECAFSYNKNDNSYERLNKVYGYSDIEPSLIRNNPYNNTLIIVYKNSNIDVVKNGAVTNVGDLYRAQNIGDKTVTSITFSGSLAYLACGFGIAVFDTETLEFKDKYIIGPNATNLFVYQVALSSTDIYAATKTGVYTASLSSSNLSSYTSWSKVNNLPSGLYNGAVYFGNKVIVNFSTSGLAKDTLFQFDGITWSKYTSKIYVLAPAQTYTIRKIDVSDDKTQFITIDQWGFETFDASGNGIARAWGFPDPPLYHALSDVAADPTEAGYYWIADAANGLYKIKISTTSATAASIQQYVINGPGMNAVSSMVLQNGKLLVAPAYLGIGMFSTYVQSYPFVFEDNTWRTATKPNNTPTFDLNCVAFDRLDKNHYYAGSWANGVIEFRNDAEVARYDDNNTSAQLHGIDNVTNPDTRVGALAVDNDNNVWAGLGDTQFLLSVKKASTGTWTSFDFSQTNSVGGALGPPPRIGKIIIDTNKQVWAVAYGIGVFVYKIDAAFTQPNPANSKKLTNIAGYGGLASTEVISIAEDKNGDIWVGTDKGISVIYNPESVFTPGANYDAQPIYIEQDGKTQLLLQTDEVMCITVDGANNKWCGTRSSGVYCFSPDGQKQLYHFTTDNSPLFSNTVLDVKINPGTGEVFIGTDKGILSFQNIITEGNQHFNNVYAYPNPVKPGYDGPILIHGMISGAVIKILDVAGNFVYETTSQGGQALWDGKNFKGQRVASGVYIVLCATSDGEEKVMTKIMLLN